jgi:hypothetical protein
MPHPRCCPTSAELTAFLVGDLPEGELDEVAEHLEGCPSCEAAARALDGLADTRLTPFRSAARAPAVPEPALPRQVGDYEILDEVGRGGRGVVYRARHAQLRRVVALKVLRGAAFADPHERRRFRNEAEAVARLQHPHIVQVFDVGEWRPPDGGPPVPYFALEFVDGGNLAARSAGRSPRRYACAETLAEDLRRFLAGEPVVARPVGMVERAVKWGRRRPAVSGLLAALVLVTLAGFALATGHWREALYQKGLADDRAAREAAARRRAQEMEEEEKNARRQAERLSAGAVLDQGINLCPRGDVAHGLLWLARGLELAARAEDADLERVARINLAAWRRQVVRQRARFTPGRAAAFSPDGRLVATGGWDRTACLWDAATGQRRGQPLAHDHPVKAVAFSPDGKTLLTASGPEEGLGSKAWLWDVATGRPLGPPLPRLSVPIAVAFSPDGKTFLTVNRGEAQLWRTADRRPQGPPLRHHFHLHAGVFSPDGRTVLTGGGDGTARLWDAATGRPRGKPLPHAGPVEAVAFSPDSKTVATDSVASTPGRVGDFIRGEARLWQAATGQPQGPPLLHRGPVKALASSPDGRTLATGSQVGERNWPMGVVNIAGGGRPSCGRRRRASPSASPWLTRRRSGPWPSARTAAPF